MFTDKDYEHYDCEQCRSDAKAIRTYMIVCPDCGNKRCPQAENHRFQCTKSNDTNQVGTLKLENDNGADIEDTMSNNEISNIGHLLLSWLKFELAYQHGLADFIGLERAFDSEDIPTSHLKHSPIHSVKENDDLRVHLLETALYKDKAHRLYVKLDELAQTIISMGMDIPQFESNSEKKISINKIQNIGVGFLNYLKLKNAENVLYEEFRHFIDTKDSENMFIKQKEWGEATTKAIDQYHALLDSAYIELGVKNQPYEVIGHKVKEWMATA